MIKQYIGNSLYLGGKLAEIEPINFSCFNFNNNFNSELQEMGKDFFYFVTTDEDYLKARSTNIHWNWKYSNPDGTFLDRYKRTKMARKLAEIQAFNELKSYPIEAFIKNSQEFSTRTYSFGVIPVSLESLSDAEPEDKKVFKINLEYSEPEQETVVEINNLDKQ